MLSGKKWRWYRTEAGRYLPKDELQALGPAAEAAVVEAVSRVRRGEHFHYELEQINRDLKAVRVFFDGSTYRLLFASVGAHDEVLLGLHVIQKKDARLPLQARRTAQRRLADWESRGRP